MTNIKATYKDSLFVKMFGDSEKKYLLELYRALHPEDTSMTVDRLKIVSIENVFINDVYNDLGFLADDKLMVLVEAQSTWNMNILIRMLIYLGKTYRDFIYDDTIRKSKIYSTETVQIPEPELYVLYSGPKGDKKRVLSLKEDIFHGKDVGMDLKVQVIFADDNRRDIIGQYLAFCTIAKEQYKRYKEQEVAIRETIRICIENGNMVEYLQRHRKEVESYMMAILTQEEAYEAYGDYCTRKGLEQGLEKGIEQGRAEERKIADQQLKQMEQQKNDEIAKLKAELASLKTK